MQGPMTIHPHAEAQMAKRLVSRNQVLATLINPDRTFEGHSGRLIAERDTIVGNTIRVVYEVQPVGILVVTVIRMKR